MKTRPSPGPRPASRRPVAGRRRFFPSARPAVVVLLIVFAVVVGFTETARSQVAVYSGSLPDGTYSGGIYLRVGNASLNLGGYGDMTRSLASAGDATVIIDTDAPSLSGTWTLEGSGTMGGGGTYRGVTVTFSGSSVFTGSGTFSGTPLNGRLTGTSKETGEWTLNGPKGPILGPFPIGGLGIGFSYDEPLTDLLNECSQLLGKWDSQLEKKLEAQGPNIQVTTLVAYFVLSDEKVITRESATADRLRGLAKQGNSTLGNARGGGDAFLAIDKGVAVLRGVEKLQADIAKKESDCPTDKAFQNILTLIAQDGLDAVLEGFENDPTLGANAKLFRDMIRLGEGTGATGSGAQDTVRAGELDGRMEAQANEAFDQAIQSYTSGFDPALDEAVSLAALGEQQGWGLENSAGVTGTDVLAETGN